MKVLSFMVICCDTTAASTETWTIAVLPLKVFASILRVSLSIAIIPFTEVLSVKVDSDMDTEVVAK